jgi:hypothetical protein
MQRMVNGVRCQTLSSRERREQSSLLFAHHSKIVLSMLVAILGLDYVTLRCRFARKRNIPVVVSSSATFIPAWSI